MLPTVIIPTYKRPQIVMQALQSLQEQSFPDFEILIVDNAVDLAVEQKINVFNRTARLPAIYIPEKRLGVHYARNKAAQLASGDLLLFTDDDVTFDPHWVDAYVKAFYDHPEMSASGGPVRPHWDQNPPQWLLNYIGKTDSFGILSLMEPYQTFNLSERGYFYSCNMAIWKSKLMERRGFHPEATGDIWIGDGETGLNLDMQAEGDLIGYVPNALVYHHIPLSRMTPAYFRLRQANQGASQAYTRYHKGIPRTGRIIIRFCRIILDNFPAWIAAPLMWNRTNRIALNTQMRTAHSFSEIGYTLKMMRDPDFRTMILKRDWLNSGMEMTNKIFDAELKGS